MWAMPFLIRITAQGIQINCGNNIILVSAPFCPYFWEVVWAIIRLSPHFTDAIQILKRDLPDLAFICPVSNSVAKEVGAQAGHDPRMNDMILLPESAKLDAMACSDVALACSGTVTTQLACAGVPTVVAYRMNPATFFIVKQIFSPNYISMVNIAAEATLCLLYTSPSPRDQRGSRMPSSA